ncbi:MAG: hypothetical protein WCG52_04540, partial [bacterium]
QLRRRSRSGDPANQLSGSKRVNSEDIGAGVLRFATVAYPGYTIVFPYWSKRYRAGVLRFATVAYPGYTIVFPYWSKRYRAGV